MGKKTLPLHRSKKPIQKLADVVGEKGFIFPPQLANDCNPENGQPSLMVSINSKKTYIPVGKMTTINADVYSVLKDAGIVIAEKDYSAEGAFDPLKPTDF